jgi:chromosome transmission fidelity protein 18
MNILRVSYIDPTFDRCAAAHEWMSSSDIYRSHKANGVDQYAMEALHIPSAAAAIHLLCRVEQRQDLTYSTRDLADSQYQMEANSALAQKFVEGLSLRARGTRSVNQLATETLPYALWILSAGEGSSALARAATSVELLSQGERHAFEQHAGTLRALGLSYVVEQEEAASGREYRNLSMKIRLEPPIERIVQFNDLPNRRLEIPPAVRRFAGKEVR